jgi:hypothetical protein
MSGYRDELEAAQMRISTLEARLEEREAALRAREAELAERDTKIARLERQTFVATAPETAQRSGSVGIYGVLAVLAAGAVVGAGVVFFTRTAPREPAAAIANATSAPPSPALPPDLQPPELDAPDLIPPVEPPVTEPPPKSGLEFDRAAAAAALTKATTEAKTCAKQGDPPSQARIQIIFAPSGRVTSASLQGSPYAGTLVGGCIARKFRDVTVPPFEGSPVIVSKSLSVP